MTADRSGIQARLAAATPGPWVVEPSKYVSGRYVVAEGGRQIRHATETSPVDADLIAHAPADLAALLAELDAKDAALARVRELADDPYRITRNRSVVQREYVLADDLRAALDGDGTPGPANATNAPTVAKRTADGGSA